MNSEDERMLEAFEKSSNAKISEITLMGDRNVIIQTITLLSYIRNAINSKTEKEIKIGINKNFGNTEFNFLVNNTAVDDLISKETIDIN